MKKETEKFEILETQDDRLWIHSKVRGFGQWILNSELEKLFQNSLEEQESR